MGEASTTKPIEVSISWVTRTLGVFILLLVIASTTAWTLNHLGVRPNGKSLFYLDTEANIPTYFSSMQLLFAALLLTVIAACKRRERDLFAHHWSILAAGFFMMSIDEFCQFHERLVKPVKMVLHENRLGIWSAAWVIPAIIGCVAIGLFFWKFLARLPKTTRREFIMAAGLFLGGAIGVEMIEGRHSELYGNKNMGFMLYVTIEEGMEMTGTLYFIRSLLRYLGSNSCGTFSLVDSKPAVGRSDA